MNFLESILTHKRQEVSSRKQLLPQSRLERMMWYDQPCRSLEEALRGRHLGVIAEIKKASPSRGIIRKDFDPYEIAAEYAKSGATAISVLTDGRFFHGDLEFILKMRNTVLVPILRKDFIIDAYQLHESKAFGADAVLLIAAAVRPEELTELCREAQLIGLETLVEVHTEKEIESLDFSVVRLVGINNRDLTSFETDVDTSIRLKKHLPADIITVSESGISSAEQVSRLVQQGIHAVLIGESFMRAESPGRAVAELIAQISWGDNES